MNTPQEDGAVTRTSESVGEERWYLPTFWERLVLMRWRVIYFVPAALALGLLFFAPFAIFFWWKVLLILVALPMGAALKAGKNAIALRTEPFCIHCGYDLTTLAERHPCPECGVPFTFAEIDDYRRDPHWFIRRRKMNQVLSQSGKVFEAGPVRSRRSRDGT